MRTTPLAVLVGLTALCARVFAGADPSRVEVLTWQAPQSGWLYIVDATLGESRVFLIDPDTGKIGGIIQAGYSPDIAVSPRGDRLYLASVVGNCGQNCDRLTVIDTQAGRVLSTTAIPDRVHYKVYPLPSRMAVSSDGRTVYLLKWQGPPSGDTPVALAAFDVAHQRFYDAAIELGGCVSGGFVPAADEHQLGFHCALSNEIAFYRSRGPARAAHDAGGARAVAGVDRALIHRL
jgi:hypothetical protein